MTIAVREPAVAGLFYPDNRSELLTQVEDQLLQNPCSGERPKALIVPHAGYIYSGGVAARAFNLLRPHSEHFSKVTVLGPSHRVPLEGLALPDCDSYRTPLGDVALDQQGIDQIADLPQVQQMSIAHAQEHSLEVQLPFLQVLLPQFKLLPLVVGRCPSALVAEVLERLWDDPNRLVVISTDLSHFHDYQDACHLDRSTSDLICQLREPLMGEQACGCYPLNGLLNLLKQRGMAVELLDLKNSGDTAGSKDRVVGYGAYAVF
ncbi:MAG: AmmeMemoRadiSam system protein B [Motiliproteus sp.]|nr:AmmeMemoRadiSam system protein B [Motiliproteus sp.]MCW9051285.1 AmmeMemoRadiSam system protein B [Motiliproteus sp.]